MTQASIGFFSNARMLSWGSPTFPWKTTTTASRDSVIALPPSGMFFMRFDESPKSLPLEITRSLRRACSGARVWDDTAVRNYLVFLHLLPETPGARGGAAGAAKSDGEAPRTGGIRSVLRETAVYSPRIPDASFRLLCVYHRVNYLFRLVWDVCVCVCVLFISASGRNEAHAHPGPFASL